MRFIPARYLENWHTEVDKLAQSHAPLLGSTTQNPYFPFDQVQEYTTQYIVNKKERPIAGLCDERLIKLVQKSESKPIALAACTHLLSPQAVRTLIVQDFSRLDTGSYLQLIIIAHLLKPNAVEALDFERAKALQVVYHDLRALSDGQYLRSLFNLIKIGVPKTSLVYSTLHTQVLSAIPQVAASLATLRTKYQWHQAWNTISWISDFLSNEIPISADCLDPIELLDRNFRTWRMWATWEPNESKTSENRCDETQRKLLGEFLALEGPDAWIPPKSNVCEGYLAVGPLIESSVARFGSGKIMIKLEDGTEEEAHGLLRRLYSCIGQATHHSHDNVDLCIELFVGVDITAESLDVMEAVGTTAGREVTSQLLKLYKSLRQDKVDKIQAAKELLPLLRSPECERLKNSSVGKLTADIVMQEILDIQAKLTAAWESEILNPTPVSTLQLRVIECQLQVIGNDLKDCVAELQRSSLATATFFDLLKYWPAYHDLVELQSLRQKLNILTGDEVARVRVKIIDCLRDLLIFRGSVDQETRDMVRTLKTCFKSSPGQPRQQLATLLADGRGKFRMVCISTMVILSTKDVLRLTKIMRTWSGPGWDVACGKMARFLAAVDEDHAEIVIAWKPVLYRMLKAKGETLVITASAWKPGHYIDFLVNIRTVFGDIVWNPKLSPPIMDPSLQEWATRLAPHKPVFARLEAEKRAHPAFQHFVAGKDPWILEGILCHLGLEDLRVETTALYEASYGITGLLTDENAQDVYDVLCSVYHTTQNGAAACVRLLSLCHNCQDDVASLLLNGWLKDSSWSEYDQMGFKDLARLLKISVVPTETSTETLEAAADYMDSRYAELIAEAKRLDSMRVQLKARDCEGVSQLLYDNHIEDTTSLEDSFATLPIELLNVVESVDESEVEIIFPLNDITPLQRAAMGVGNAQSLLIRLYIGDYGSQSKFCIHLDNEPKIDSHNVHSQWTVSSFTRAPELPVCHGAVTPATYQLARVLSRYLVNGFKDLLSIHSLISTTLKAMGSQCLICGALHGAALRRATLCNSSECLHIFSRSPIEIRLGLINDDPLAVDMILTMINSALSSGFHNILPNCPFDQKTCLKILREMPSIEKIKQSKFLWETIKDMNDGKTDQFLTWAICSFRGFLSTATGNLRIPSLPPGTLQFVLANAAPAKEIAFATEFAKNSQQSSVVFHGTTLDRLYLIMHQGLKVMSGTSLQAYGAAYGNGVYLAEEPSTSWAYAKAATSNVNWKNSAIGIERVLLGCEMTAPSSVPVAGGIHVISTEASVMVRYIFVVPSATVTMPISGHVSPAMMSVFNSLRSKAI